MLYGVIIRAKKSGSCDENLSTALEEVTRAFHPKLRFKGLSHLQNPIAMILVHVVTATTIKICVNF